MRDFIHDFLAIGDFTLAILAISFGIMGRWKNKKESFKNNKLNNIGITIGILSIVLHLLFIFVFFPVYYRLQYNNVVSDSAIDLSKEISDDDENSDRKKEVINTEEINASQSEDGMRDTYNKQLQIDCEGFKESMNWDCNCFVAETKKMFPNSDDYFRIRSDEFKYSKENDAWFSILDQKCLNKKNEKK
jgi:hypothetical protein